MTANGRPESEQLVASAEGAEKATSTPERDEGDRQPARGLELSVGTGGSRGNNTATDHEKAVKFAPCARHSGMKDVPDPTSTEPLVDTNRIPSAAGRSARSVSGFPAVADEYSALDSGELGLWSRSQQPAPPVLYAGRSPITRRSNRRTGVAAHSQHVGLADGYGPRLPR